MHEKDAKEERRKKKRIRKSVCTRKRGPCGCRVTDEDEEEEEDDGRRRPGD